MTVTVELTVEVMVMVMVKVLTDSVAVLAAGDASATRTVYAVVAALGIIGVALIVLAVWLLKQTKPERELLAPLERMHDRSWLKQSPAQMRRDLDAVRPQGAHPVVPGKEVPIVDDDFELNRPALANFDDLRAQLAADARRRSSSGADPLLAPRTTPTTPARDSASAPAPEPASNGGDIAQFDDTTGARRPDVPTEDGDGTVTHSAKGSTDIAALATSVDAPDASEADAQPDPDVEPDVDPDVDLDVEPDVDLDVEPDVDVDVEPDVDPDGPPSDRALANDRADD